MAKREIGTKITLDGEAQFKASVSAINQNLAVLSSEMGAATSAFDKNNMSMSDLQKKSEIYGRQIDAQKQKLEVYNKALTEAEKLKTQNAEAAERAAKEYGEESEEAQKARVALEQSVKIYNDYQIKVNNTVKSINQLEKAQKDTDKAAEELKNSTKSLADRLKDMAAVAGKAAAEVAKIGAKTVTKGVEAGVKAVTAYTTALSGAATAAFGLAASAGAMADDVNTLSKVTGISTEQLQIYSLYSAQVDVSTETIAKAMQKLTVNMGDAASGSATAAAKFDVLGISVKDVNGNLKSNDEVFAEAIEKLGQMTNETERDAVAMDLFGKSAQELNPLILGGADAFREMGEAAKENGLVLSQDALDSLNAFNDSIDNLKTNISGASNVIAGTFVNSFKRFTDLAGNNAAKVIVNIADIFSGKAVDGSGLTNKLKDIGNELTVIVSEELPAFINGFNTVIIAGLQAAAETLSTAVTTLLPQLFTGFDNLTSGLIGLLPTLVPDVVKGGVMLFSGLLTSLNKISDQLMPMLPDLINQTVDVLINNLPTLIDGAFVLFTGLVTGLGNAMPTLIKKVIELVPVIVSSLLEQVPLLVQCGADLIIALAKGLPDSIPVVIEAVPQIITAIIDTIMTTDWLTIGKDVVTAIMEGMTNSRTLILEYALKFVNSVKESIAELWNNSATSNFFVGGVANLAVQPERSGGSSQGGRRDIGNVYLTVNSNQPLSPTEIARQTRNSLTLAGLS